MNKKKKVVIVGSSIAGAAAAFLLAKNFDVVVYEQKKRNEIGKKLCANICTDLFGEIIKSYGLDKRRFIKTYYGHVMFQSENNWARLPTKEYEINRQKFIDALILKARKRGAKFVFSEKLKDVDENEKITLIFTKGKKKIREEADIVIGADGASSKVAEQTGLAKKRKFFLAILASLNRKEVRNFDVKKGENRVFVGKRFGHYAYISSSEKSIKVGLMDDFKKDVVGEFRKFLLFLGVKDAKKIKVHGALIPKPSVLKTKKRVFLIGDAGGYQKFSEGGIIPALLSAEALKDILFEGNYSKRRKLKRRTSLNKLAVLFFSFMNDKNWDELIEVMKDEKYTSLVAKRDWFGKEDFMLLLSPKIVKFALRALFT